jgi:hypothetical protein
MDTWATVEIEANSLHEALTKADYDGDLPWAYETDFDSAVTVESDLISEGETEDLLGVEFVDPYLGRDDIVWEVNASVGDGMWQAEVVTADEDHDNDLGVMDLYTADHIKANRIVR